MKISLTELKHQPKEECQSKDQAQQDKPQCLPDEPQRLPDERRPLPDEQRPQIQRLVDPKRQALRQDDGLLLNALKAQVREKSQQSQITGKIHYQKLVAYFMKKTNRFVQISRNVLLITFQIC